MNPLRGKTMKTIPSLAFLLAAASLCPAQEENPFLKQTTQKKAAPAEAGGSFLSLEEHIVVPANLVDGWLAAHPEENDAGELRAAVQRWIAEGKATLDFTGLNAGIVGREFAADSVLEQIYPTHFEPGNREDEWKLPTSFETNYIGYQITGDAVRQKDELTVRAVLDATKMLPQQPWDKLTEETRQPDDIFTPRFRKFRVREEAPAEEKDSRGRTRPTRRTPEGVSYPAGKIHLALRADENPLEPVVKEAKGDASENENPPELAADRPVRLIFFRDDPVEDSPAGNDPLPEDYLLSMRLIQVHQLQLSNWLQKRELGGAAKELNEALEEWNQDGNVEVIRTLSGAGRTGTITMIEDSREIVYATEYEPCERTTSDEGKDSRLEFATATSFETRNVGGLLTSDIQSDPGGPLLRLQMERIIHSGFTVHHRVLRDGEWVADMTMPRFSTNRWGTTLRLKRGEWILVGSGAAFKEKGEIDNAHTVLAFVKVE